jgi:cobyrinic acid a,c-diamide synthase
MSAPAQLVVSAAGTGAGKTLIALALCQAFRNEGFRVIAYKAGPDYIDARLYASVLGAPAHNVDLWLDGEEGVRRHVALTAGDADIVIVEGMMGLFDGDDAGATSTAGIANVLDAPVVTVLDTWSASQSAAAVALGLRAYDPRLRHLGVILNRVGGPSHAAAVRAACAHALSRPDARTRSRGVSRRHGGDRDARDRTIEADRSACFDHRRVELGTPRNVATAESSDACAGRVR